MIERRRKMLAHSIQKELNAAITDHLKDPRLDGCFITQIELTLDGKTATIGFHANDFQNCEKALMKSKNYLRSIIAQSLHTHSIPHLLFRADKGWQNTHRIEDLLRKIQTPSS